MINKITILNNCDGLLLFKNTIIVDRVFQHTNMGLATYPSQPGDSGAPIIYHHDGESELIGVHEGVVCVFESPSENQQSLLS